MQLLKYQGLFPVYEYDKSFIRGVIALFYADRARVSLGNKHQQRWSLLLCAHTHTNKKTKEVIDVVTTFANEHSAYNSLLAQNVLVNHKISN